MSIKGLMIFSFLLLLVTGSGACSKNKGDHTGAEKFEIIKWREKDGTEYVHRDRMLADLIQNHPLKGLSKEAVIEMLGQPTRADSSYLFYTISSPRFAGIPLSNKSLVIKLDSNNEVEWRKIHR